MGCGTCQSICPEVFEIDDGKAKVIKQKDVLCIKEAIESCPVDAIEKEVNKNETNKIKKGK